MINATKSKKRFPNLIFSLYEKKTLLITVTFQFVNLKLEVANLEYELEYFEGDPTTSLDKSMNTDKNERIQSASILIAF